MKKITPEVQPGLSPFIGKRYVFYWEATIALLFKLDLVLAFKAPELCEMFQGTLWTFKCKS